jgi:hypothetical protein
MFPQILGPNMTLSYFILIFFLDDSMVGPNFFQSRCKFYGTSKEKEVKFVSCHFEVVRRKLIENKTRQVAMQPPPDSLKELPPNTSSSLCSAI